MDVPPLQPHDGFWLCVSVSLLSSVFFSLGLPMQVLTVSTMVADVSAHLLNLFQRGLGVFRVFGYCYLDIV